MAYLKFAYVRRAAACTLMATMLSAAADPESIKKGLDDFRSGRFAEALQDWRQASANGDPNGAVYVGVLYDSGLGVPQNYTSARLWYVTAANAGSAVGAFNVGVLYDAGLGVAKDEAQAAAWYMRAAKLGSARADYNLGMLYETGTGVRRSRSRAIAFYTRAAHHGITAARMHLQSLGQNFAGDVQTPQDHAMQDFQKAQALLLARGPSTATRMAALFRNAADLHNPLAEYDLGYCYEHAMGVVRDPDQAAGYYRRAANDTHDDALKKMAQDAANGLKASPASAKP